MAQAHGLKTESIWINAIIREIARTMAIYGRRPVRETIVLWTKDSNHLQQSC